MSKPTTATATCPDSRTPPSEEPPSFLADCMLGRLARWLRILGYDTVYFRQITDKELLAYHHGSGRILLTRDTALSRSPELGAYLFIRDDNWQAQLRQVLETLDLTVVLTRMFTLCADCNQALQVLRPAEVHGKVPDFVAATQKEFRGCASCGRIYWPGSHRRHVLKVLKGIASLEGDEMVNPGGAA